MKRSGIVKIDNQHMLLLNTIIMARELISTDKFIALLHLLGKMEQYIHMHFSDEEKMMRDNDVPGYEAHVLEHNKFKSVVHQKMRNLLDTGEVLEDLLVFAEDWITKHINAEAELFSRHIKNNTVRGSKVDHFVWGEDDAGSSPAAPTKNIPLKLI